MSVFYGYPAKLIAQWCGVSVRTASRWKRPGTRVPRPALRLFVLHRDGRVLGPEWTGWTVARDRLMDPEGNRTNARQLRAFSLCMQVAAEAVRTDPQAQERYWRLLDAG